MIFNNYKIIILDFDGVIISSNGVKRKLFLNLIKNKSSNQKNELIKNFLDLNPHLDRKKKIKHIANNIFELGYNKKKIECLIETFTFKSLNELKNTKLIKGLRGFLKKNEHKLFLINSAADKLEILEVLRHKKIDKYFVGIYGNENSKTRNMKIIFDKYKIEKKYFCFLGDQLTDYKIAIYHKVKFIGINQIKFRSHSKKIDNFNNFTQFL